MAEFCEMRNQRDSSRVFYRRAETLARSAVADSPHDVDAARDLGIVLGTYGNFHASGGEIDSALAVSEEGLRLFEGLAARDPANMLFPSDVAEAIHDIGGILTMGRRYPAAEREFADAYQRFARIAGADTANAESRIFMARCGRQAGEACQAVARGPGSEAERSRWSSRALTWLVRSRDLYRALAAAGQLHGEETTAPEEVERLIAANRSRSPGP
jgi:hypothetical protein